MQLVMALPPSQLARALGSQPLLWPWGVFIFIAFAADTNFPEMPTADAAWSRDF
jgi:hypothetical protein